MKRTILTLTCCVVSVFAAGVALASEEGKGRVDWEGGYVIATGSATARADEPKAKARLKAQTAAKVVAQRALTEIIKGVRVNSETTVRNMMLEEDVIKTRVEGFLKGAMITKTDVEYIEGAPLATVEMRVCLTGGVGECASKPNLTSVLEVEKRKEPPFVPAERFIVLTAPPPVAPPQIDVPAPLPPPVIQAPVVQTTVDIEPIYDPNRPVTSLVLNLNGRYFEREMLPVVITSTSGSLQTVYSVKSVNPGVVRTYGAVRYAETIDGARTHQTAGANPMIITVNEVTKENMILIRPKDATLIRHTLGNGNNYLGEAKVVISIR